MEENSVLDENQVEGNRIKTKVGNLEVEDYYLIQVVFIDGIVVGRIKNEKEIIVIQLKI